MIRLDADAGTLEVLVSPDVMATQDLHRAGPLGNEHGMGRELFAGFRELVARADQGASAFGIA